MARFQRGWLRQEDRKAGKTWVLRYNTTRQSDGKRVEHTMPIGLVRDFPRESQVWKEIEKMHLNLNKPEPTGRVTFGELAASYMQYELAEDSGKAHTSIERANQVLKNRLIPHMFMSPRVVPW